MKKYLFGIFATIVLSTTLNAQSVMASGEAFIVKNNDFESAEKSENYVIFTINYPNSMHISVNGNITEYDIVSSNHTGGGKTLKCQVKNNSGEIMPVTISLLNSADVIMFPWDPSYGTIGFIKIKLTRDDKRILELNKLY